MDAAQDPRIQIVTQFIAAYYQTFDKNNDDRKNLAGAYVREMLGPADRKSLMFIS